MLRGLLLLAAFICFSGLAHAQSNPLLGLWMTEAKDGVVEFYGCEGGHYCGRFYWLEEDSAENPSLDDKNPDPALKKRPLCGMTFLGGFTDAGEGRYEGGWIYSPRHGSMFSSQLKLTEKDMLSLRGYVFLPILGGTQLWQRVEKVDACHLMVKK